MRSSVQFWDRFLAGFSAGFSAGFFVFRIETEPWVRVRATVPRVSASNPISSWSNSRPPPPTLAPRFDQGGRVESLGAGDAYTPPSLQTHSAYLSPSLWVTDFEVLPRKIWFDENKALLPPRKIGIHVKRTNAKWNGSIYQSQLNK